MTAAPATTEKTSEKKPAKYQFVSQYVADLRTLIGYYIGYVDQHISDPVENYETLKNDMTVKQGMHTLSIIVAGES